jgi:hypothetical protein
MVKALLFLAGLSWNQPQQGLRLNAFFVPAFQSDLIQFFQFFLYFPIQGNDLVAKPMLWQFLGWNWGC